MKFQFKINKLALIRDTFVLNNDYRLKQKNSPFLFWTKLEKQLWEKFKNEPGYYLINPIYSDWAFKKIYILAEKKGIEKTFLNIAKTIRKIYKDITNSKEFKQLFSETEKYKIFVERQWNKNKNFVLSYFKNDLGLKIPNYTITIYIFHPKSHNGYADCQTKSILWGHPENWKNYTTVYLAHELLHILTYKKLKDFDVMHALIELATDNELRIRLNKKGKYFIPKQKKKMPLHIKKLFDLERKIYPYWKEYLKNRKGRNIFDLEREIIQKLK